MGFDTTSRHLGILLPEWLGAGYDQAWDLVSQSLGADTRPGKIFSLGWRGLGHRGITSTRYAALLAALHAPGTKGHEGNHEEEEVRTNYLFNACSTVECLLFACYGIGSALAPTIFLTEKSEHLGLKRHQIVGKFTQVWPAYPLTVSLQALLASDHIRQLFTMRDVATHRGSPPRSFHLGGPLHRQVTVPSNPKDLPDLWVSDQEIGAHAFGTWHAEMAHLVKASIDSVVGFEPLKK